MRIYFSPIVGDTTIDYRFIGEKMIVTIGEVTDEFDFTGFPDGKLEVEDVETILPIQVVVSAERIGGVLFVQLLNFISDSATEFEQFPEWIEVGEE